MLPRAPLVATLALAIVTLAAADDRHPIVASSPLPPASGSMYRGGPEHLGVYTGGGPTLAGLVWRFPTEGDVVSSPTIAGDRVYVGSGDGGVYALDLATGSRRWRYDAGSPVASSPAVGMGLVFATARDGSAFAVDAATGARRWRLTTGATLPLPWGHESGDHYDSSPVLAGGRVIFGAGDGRVYAVEPRSGRILWRATTGGRIRSSPAVANDRVYVGSFDGKVYCFDLETGAERWHHDTEGASLESGNYGFDRRSIQSSPAVSRGVVYVGARDGFLYALDAADGHRKWRVDHRISWVIGAPAVSGGSIYVGSSDAHFMQALDTAGAERWRFDAQVPVWSSPAVAGDLVYFGDGIGRLHAVDRQTGKERWHFRTGSTTFGSPSIAGDLVVIGSTDGAVYAVRANAGPPIERAVFFDSTLIRVARVPHPEVTAQFFAARGYERLGVATLAPFLEARIADRAPSVVVFAIDHVPDALGTGPARSSLLRRYLDAGGKVVWTGVPPLLWPVDSTGQPTNLSGLRWDAPSDALGVPHDRTIFDQRGVHATAAGRALGLPPRWRDAWSVDPHGVTRVLALDEWGLAAAWVRSYGGRPGSGFYRVPGDEPMYPYLAAESTF